MQEKFEKYLFENCILKSENRILLAVSGGIDSMLMLNLFLKVKGLNISVAHCNFQLRKEESDKDELLVKEFCNLHEITFHHKSFDTTQYAKDKRVSVQMAARELRYEWFFNLVQEYNYDLLSTAHHKNDNTETMLLNLVRGTGITGLHGIRALNKNVIRPMLFCTRSEIEFYAEKIKLQWREDASNIKNDYARNKIRNKVIPFLKELNPSLEDTFVDNASNISDAEILLNDYVDDKVKTISSTVDEKISVSINELKKVPNYKSFLKIFLAKFGFNHTVIHNIIDGLSQQSGKQFYAESYELLLDRTELILSPVFNAIKTCTIVHQHENCVDCEGFRLSLLPSIVTNCELILDRGKNTVLLDYDKLGFPLRIRPWEHGDIFKPLGLKGKKKVSDYLIDEKINRIEKQRVMVLTSGDDIAWIIGHRMDERFKLNNRTKKYLEIKMNIIS